jgi:transcriptional regulator with XRE-family HTH domain
MNDNKNKAGQLIKEKRISLNISQRKLAKICGVSDSTICRLESGNTIDPTIKVLKLLSEALDLDFINLVKLITEDTNESK